MKINLIYFLTHLSIISIILILYFGIKLDEQIRYSINEIIRAIIIFPIFLFDDEFKFKEEEKLAKKLSKVFLWIAVTIIFVSFIRNIVIIFKLIGSK